MNTLHRTRFAALVFCLLAPLAAQAKLLALSEIAKWPELEGGNWEFVGRNMGLLPNPLKMPLKPAIMARMRPKFNADGSPKWNAGLPGYILTGTCEPEGLPNFTGTQFFYSRAGIFITGVTDYSSIDRHVFMDGRKHDDPDPTYYGESVGHWEGDTLVINSTGFLAQVPIALGVRGGGTQEIIERYRITGPGRAELKLTIIDPAVLTAPYTTTYQMVMTTDDSVQELFCTNNRNATSTVDLTPPQ